MLLWAGVLYSYTIYFCIMEVIDTNVIEHVHFPPKEQLQNKLGFLIFLKKCLKIIIKYILVA